MGITIDFEMRWAIRKFAHEHEIKESDVYRAFEETARDASGKRCALCRRGVADHFIDRLLAYGDAEAESRCCPSMRLTLE